jgi:transposase-like protein
MGQKYRIETCELKVYEVDYEDIDKCPTCKSENTWCISECMSLYRCEDCGEEYTIE